MPANPPINSVQRRRTVDRMARRAVQIGFLLLFLYPLFLVIYQRVTFRAAPNFASWLLPWDPLLLTGHLARREWAGLVIGAPLLLIALTLILGRFFCGWVCPVGTVLDLVRPLAFWQKKRKPSRATRLFPANANSHLRYYLLIAVALAGLFSLQVLGLLDPLVIFQRATTALASNFFALQQPPQRIFLSVISLMFCGHPAARAVAAALLVPQPVPAGRADQPLLPVQPAQSTGEQRVQFLRRLPARLCDERDPAERAARHRLLRLHLLPGMRERLPEHGDFVRVWDAGGEAMAAEPANQQIGKSANRRIGESRLSHSPTLPFSLPPNRSSRAAISRSPGSSGPR